jgi:phenylalanyl-tRNA synthetase beta chain
MRVPLSWLADYVDVELAPGRLAETLTMLGLEVTAIERRGEEWQGVVVGEILDVRPHPRAERLLLATVRTGGADGPADGTPKDEAASEGEATSEGEAVYEIVCGAHNIAAGQRVPVALPGAILPDGRRIETTTIAGQASQGMLCSGDELGLTADAEGILILPGDTPLGQPLAELFGDTVLDVDVKANRGDLLSLVGVAREIAAVTAQPVRWPEVQLREDGPPIDQSLSLDVRDRTLCPRFVARYVTGVTVGPSPSWVQMRLLAAGIRPVSNVVDASNYAMVELGKPTHTFDALHVRGRAIVVRRASPGEPLETLDHVVRDLDPETLVIADGEGPIGIAGVMGGADSEVGPSTTAVVVESAIFDPVTIRMTARRFGLRSEASVRFEKGQEARLAAIGADRVCQLIEAWAGGRTAPGRLDSASDEPAPRRVPFRPSRINRLLGTDLPAARMSELLARLSFGIESARMGDVVPVGATDDAVALDAVGAGEALVATVPSWRADVVDEADVAEEVARLHGYLHIQPTLPGTRPPPYRPDPMAPLDRMRQILAGAGLSEIVTHALIASPDHERIHVDDGDGHAIHVTNPVSVDHSVLRRMLLPGLLAALALNERARRPDVAIFEIGETYRLDERSPVESRRLAILLAGALWPAAWNRHAHVADVWDLRGYLELLLASLGAPAPRYEPRPAVPGVEHPGRTAEMLVQGPDERWTRAGVVTELDPRVVEAFEARAESVVYAELSLDPILAAVPGQRRVRDLPRQPAAERDVAVVVPAATAAAEVIDVIREAAGAALDGLVLFDVYRGAPLGEAEKSLALRLWLETDDAGARESVVQSVVTALTARGWRLRT